MATKPGDKTLSMAGVGGFAAQGPDQQRLRFHQAVASGEVERRKVDQFTIKARTGRGFLVPRGQVMRLCCADGPQVGDMIVFNADDHSETFWAARTRVIHGGHLTTGHQLWSTPPRMRPMMTLIADTVPSDGLDHGAKPHDLLFCRCDARFYEIVHDAPQAPNCQDNLARAIAEFGLGPEKVHDPLNVFMTTGLNAEGQPFYLPCAADKGDYVELIAEIDCLVAISACPGGSSGDKSRPLDVTIWQVDAA
jgi:uncharacterized protein YcgI (DUF1989 family)